MNGPGNDYSQEELDNELREEREVVDAILRDVELPVVEVLAPSVLVRPAPQPWLMRDAGYESSNNTLSAAVGLAGLPPLGWTGGGHTATAMAGFRTNESALG
jgi:hypothetical protein